MEKYGKFWKNCRFSGRIWPDWGNTTRADMAGLGSIGLKVAPEDEPPRDGLIKEAPQMVRGVTSVDTNHQLLLM